MARFGWYGACETTHSLLFVFLEDTMMIRRIIALVAPLAALVVTACGSETPQATAGDAQGTREAQRMGGATGAPGDLTGEDEVGNAESDLRVRGGAVRGVAVRRGAVRGGAVRGGAVRGGGFYGGRVHVHRGWVNGRWAPGWGWSGGRWIVGGVTQISCVVDDDCMASLGAGVAVCSYDPSVALGYCVGASW
jgi:hypothetical protein